MIKEIKQDVKKLAGVAIALFLLYLAVRYWPMIEQWAAGAWQAAVPLLTGCVIAYVINILMSFYEKWYDRLFQVEVAQKIKRIVCLIFAFLTLAAIVLVVVYLVLPELINCIAAFIRLIPAAVTMAVEFVGEDKILEYFPFLKGGFDTTEISSQVEQIITSVVSGLGGAVNSVVAALTNTFSMIISTVIGLIFSLYVLIDKEKLCHQSKRIITAYLPKKAPRLFYIIRVFDESFHSFIVGQCTEAVVLGVLCIMGMLLFRFPYAVMIGVFIGFTALIPIAGAYIGAAVGAILILMVSPIKAVEFVIFIVVLQQLEGNLIYPKVVGKSIGLPGIWVLTAITVGGGILGVGGMLLAVPLFAAGYRLLREDVNRRHGDGCRIAEESVPEAEGKEAAKDKPEEKGTDTKEQIRKKSKRSNKKWN